MKKELFAKDSKGRIRIWSITSRNLGYTMESGLVGGNMSRKPVDVFQGKANRTKEEQIELEMKSRIKRKVDAGFVYTMDEAEKVERTNGMGFELPMLAKAKVTEYDRVTSQVQIKYNGLRCLIKNIGGINYAYSKSGVLYPVVRHIMNSIKIPEGTTIDGELYLHGTSLQTINSWVKKEQPNTLKLEYQCYDLISNNPFHERLEELRSFQLGNHTHVVPTWNIQEINVVEKMAEVRADGYEGLIIRQPGFGYQSGKRNTAMLKIKQFLDGEFKVVGMTVSREGFTMIHVLALNGEIFKVTAPGTHEEKRNLINYAADYYGKYLEIEYAELSDKGIPLQAVAKHFRDFE